MPEPFEQITEILKFIDTIFVTRFLETNTYFRLKTLVITL